ncbi:hypothetical protein M405DRAFT_569354 [Rhizopogon salebrosus TDB-379]|nr:hypothetical protein M405DRAFT_569354 [Rhizopogon salebrosus TDB-379]
MQDPSERQQWIGAIKTIVLRERSMRAGLTATPHTLGGHEPRGDMDVMLSMCLQASLSSGTSPLSSASSPRSSASSRSPPRSQASPPSISSTLPDATSKPPIPVPSSLEGLRRSPTLTPPVIPPNTTTLARKPSKKSQNASTRGSSSSSSNLGSGSPSPVQSMQLHSKRMGNISAVMINNDNNNTHTGVQMHSPRSSTSTTKTIRGIFGPRSRSPSLSEADGEHTEESFGTVGHSLMNIGMGVGANITRSGSPMIRTESPAPSFVSVHDGSSTIMSNGSVYNGATPSVYHSNSTGNGSINGIPAPDLKIVKEDERLSPSPSPSPPTLVSSLPPQSTPPHSLQPPPRKKPTAIHSPADTIFQLTDTADNFSIPTSTEDLVATTTASTPRACTPVPVPDPARLSVLTMSTTNSGSGVERSSTTSSTPSHRWSRTLPKRLTPPSGPLPLTPPQLPHESQLSLCSSPSSTDSPGAAVWKRTSGSSSVSSTSVRSSPVYPHSVQRGVGLSLGGGKRRSMPPPRPAPSFAPPPPPEPQQPQQSQKTRFRTSIAQRALRLSLTAPRPPPSGVLPPRPDSPAHCQSSSSGNSTDVLSPPPRPDSAASSRSISIKQRLRILSAPSPPSMSPYDSNVIAIESPIPTTFTCTEPSFHSNPSTPKATAFTHGGSGITAHSPPTTPPLPGTPITTMQNHPSFLQLATPTLPTIPPRNPLRPSTSERLPSAPEITSLSPPPRRGSKMLLAQHLDLDSTGSEKAEGELPDFSDIRAEACFS